MPSPVTAIPPASSRAAVERFESCLAFETDCADVHAALAAGSAEFVVLDVRRPELYVRGHVPSAVNLPHDHIDPSALGAYSRETVFVVYCAGPHCNGAHRAALRLARLERPVKIMIGGMTGWLVEGFELERTTS